MFHATFNKMLVFRATFNKIFKRNMVFMEMNKPQDGAVRYIE